MELSLFGQDTLYAGNLTTAMQLSSRILAYGSLGILYAFTSDAFELVMSLMQQFHLPPKFAYGILAAYHFFRWCGRSTLLWVRPLRCGG